MLDKIAPYAKALTAVAGAVVTALVQAFPDDPNVARWCMFASTILTAVAVYLVPNKDPQALHQAESVQPPQPERVQDVVDAALNQPIRDEGI